MPGQAVPISRFVEVENKNSNEELKLDHDALRKILSKPEIAGKPLAIISVAGSMRTGKSFLLNFLLRYLRKQGWMNPHWMGGDETVADEGFSWRGGSEPDTRGILILDEVFTMKKNGREVAVLLMDTQGLYDNKSTKHTNTKLLAFSTLASSVQVLNITGLLQERDLEHLQLCLSFAKAAARSDEEEFKVQNLMILVRDWMNEDESSYGLIGGKEYMNKVLWEGRDAKELNDLRQDIKSSCENIECFLMPHPGLQVQNATKFRGRNKEINQEFKEYVQHLASHFLHPDHLVLKTITARELLEFLAACDNAFGSCPRVENVLEATAKAHWSTTGEQCKYKEEMKKNIGEDLIISKPAMDAVDRTARQKAFELFDKASRIGSDHMRTEYRQNLEQECNDDLRIYEEQMQIKKKKIELELVNSVKKATDEYRKAWGKHIGKKSLSEQELRSIHRSTSRETLEKFEMETARYKVLLTSEEDDLRTKMEEIFSTLEKQNREKLAREREIQQKDEEIRSQKSKSQEYKRYLENQREDMKTLDELCKHCTKWYNKEVHEIHNDYKPEEDLHEFLHKKKNSLNKELKTREQFRTSDMRQRWTEKKISIIKDQEKIAEKRNSDIEKSYRSGLDLQMTEVVTLYAEKMNHELQQVFIDEEALKELHKNVKRELSSRHENLPQHLKEEYNKKLENALDEKFYDFEKKNRKNENLRNVRSSSSTGFLAGLKKALNYISKGVSVITKIAGVCVGVVIPAVGKIITAVGEGISTALSFASVAITAESESD